MGDIITLRREVDPVTGEEKMVVVSVVSQDDSTPIDDSSYSIDQLKDEANNLMNQLQDVLKKLNNI